MRRLQLRTSTGMLLTYLVLTAVLLVFTSRDFSRPLHPAHHTSLERIWIQACLFVPISMAFVTALWTGLGTGTFLLRALVCTPLAILSWVVFRLLGELTRVGGDTSDERLISVVLFPAVVWVASVACFLCLRACPLTRWRMVIPSRAGGTSGQKSQQRRAAANALIIACTWLAVLYLLRMSHQWHSVFSPLELSDRWESIKSCVQHALLFVPAILLAPALTLTTWTECILYKKRWFTLLLILGMALTCLVTIANGLHYSSPNGGRFVYGLSSVTIPLFLLGCSGYRIQCQQPREEVDRREQKFNLPWQRSPLTSLIAVLVVFLSMVPTGKLRTVHRNLYLSRYFAPQEPIEVNDDGQVTKLIIGQHATDEILREQLSELAQLESVTIMSSRITDEGLRCLQRLPKLKELELIGERISGSGLRYLHKSSQLRVMSASSSNFTDTGLEELKRHTMLERLRLSNTQITDTGLVYLAGLNSLKHLDLEGTQVTDAGMLHLKRLAKLQVLDLYATQVSDGGLEVLKGMNLKSLVIPEGATTNLGMKNYLSTLGSPTELSFYAWNITDDGLVYLKELTGLKILNLSQTKVTEAGVAALQKALPDCQIIR